MEVAGQLSGVSIWLVGPDRLNGHFTFRQDPDGAWQVMTHLCQQFHLALPVHAALPGDPVAQPSLGE